MSEPLFSREELEAEPCPEAKAALAKLVTVVCCGCHLFVGMTPDAAIKDPRTGGWFGVVDHPGACEECDGTQWRYRR